MSTELDGRISHSDVQMTLVTTSLSAYVDKIILDLTTAAAKTTITTTTTTPTTAVDITSSLFVWSSGLSFSDVDYNVSEWMNSTGSADVDDGTNITAAGSRNDVTLSYVYFVLTTVVSILSIVGSVLIIATDLFFRDLRSPGRRMLTWLSLADCLTAIGNTIGVFWFICCRPNGIVLCQFHAALTIFSSISSFLWTVAIATHLYLHVCRNNAYLANRLVRIFHFTCWVIPGMVSVLAWSLNVLGRDELSDEPSWCWIKPMVAYGNTLFWQYFTGKAWELACYIAIVCLYVPVKCTLHRQVRKWNLVHSDSSSHLRQRNGGNNAGSNSDVISDASRKLILVPVVFLSLRIWGTVRFIVGEHWESQRDSLQWIAPLQAVGDSAQGIANCILFCFLTRRVRQRHYELLCLRSGTRCCERAGRRPSNETPCIRLRRVKREAMSDVDASNIQLQRVDKVTT